MYTTRLNFFSLNLEHSLIWYMNALKEGLLLSLAPQSMAAIFFWHCALLCHYYQSIAWCTLPAGTLSFSD